MRIHYRLLPVLNVLFKVLALFSLSLLVPIGVAYYGKDAGLVPLIESLGLLLLGSLVLIAATHRFKRELQPRDGFFLVVGLWTLMAAAASLPLMLFKTDLSFTDAYFESMSGLTTTGATVFIGLDNLPASINIWRHLLNWIGGMGIIVLAVAILPMLGVGGMQLFKAETPGPMKEAKLTPRIHATARNLWLVYAGITLLCTLALKTAGLSWLDAVCHAFSALSLGGFSTHDASVGFYNSPVVEGILVFFMLVAGINFATHYLVLSKRDFGIYLRDSEFKGYFLTLFFTLILLCGLMLWHGFYSDPLLVFRHVLFNLVSLATGCGYASMNYGQWPLYASLTILRLCCVLPCAGSTGGGVKMVRAIILSREAYRQMVTLLHPRAIQPLRVNGMIVPGSIIFAVLGFVFLFVLSALLMTFVLMASGMDVLSAFTAVIACIGNAGPGLGMVGPDSNYIALTDFQTWLCSFAMLLGRLEVFSVLVLFTPAFWRS